MFCIIGNIYDIKDKLIGHRISELNLTMHDIEKILKNPYYIDKPFEITDLCFSIVGENTILFNKYYKDILSISVLKNKFRGSYVWGDKNLIKESKLPSFIYNASIIQQKPKSKQYIVLFRDISSEDKNKHTYLLSDFKGHLFVWSYGKLHKELSGKSEDSYLCSNANLTNFGESIQVHGAINIDDAVKNEEIRWEKNYKAYMSKNYKELNKLIDENNSIISDIIEIFPSSDDISNEFINKNKEKIQSTMQEDWEYRFKVHLGNTKEAINLFERIKENKPSAKVFRKLVQKGNELSNIVEDLGESGKGVNQVTGLGVNIVKFIKGDARLSKGAKRYLESYFTMEGQRLLLQYYFNTDDYVPEKYKIGVTNLEPLEYIRECNLSPIDLFLKLDKGKGSEKDKAMYFFMHPKRISAMERKPDNILSNEDIKELELAYLTSITYLLNNIGCKIADDTKGEMFVSDNYTVYSKNPWDRSSILMLHSWQLTILCKQYNYVINKEVNETESKRKLNNYAEVIFVLLSRYYTNIGKYNGVPYQNKIIIDETNQKIEPVLRLNNKIEVGCRDVR